METISTPEHMQDAARRTLQDLRGRSCAGAAVLALSGELGAGKTTFTQGLAITLGVAEAVVSPTFVVMRRYPVVDQDFDDLYHIDAYRIDHADEARVLGLQEILENPRNLVVIEWPERIPNLIPHDAMRISFAHADGNVRTLSYA